MGKLFFYSTVIISIYEVSLSGLQQAEIIPDGLWIRLFEQFPMVALVLAVVYWSQKTYREDAISRHNQYKEDVAQTRQWLESMLETQRQTLREVYDGNQQFLNLLIDHIKSEQSNLNVHVKDLANQLAINTSTVKEITQVDYIFHELIARLEKK